MEPTWIIGIVVALIAGAAGGYYARRVILRGKQRSIEEKIEKDFADAKLKEQELIVEAKEKALAIIEEAKEEETERRKEISETQRRLNEREERQHKREAQIDRTEEELAAQRRDLELREKEVEQIHQKAHSPIQL